MTLPDNAEDLAKERWIRGEVIHGEYIPENDTRDLIQEAAEEIADAINYCMMLIRKYGDDNVVVNQVGFVEDHLEMAWDRLKEAEASINA